MDIMEESRFQKWVRRIVGLLKKLFPGLPIDSEPTEEGILITIEFYVARLKLLLKKDKSAVLTFFVGRKKKEKCVARFTGEILI